MVAVADRRTLLKSAAGFALAGLLLYLFGRVLGWARVLAVLRTAEPAWLVVAATAAALCLVVWAGAWGLVLCTVGVRVPLHSLVVAYYAASFVNYITPLGQTSGAPVSAYVLSTDHRAPYQESLASVLTVNALNLAPMLTFAGAGAIALGRGERVPDLLRPVLLGGGLLTVSFPLVAYSLYVNKPRVVAGVSRLAQWGSRRTSLVHPAEIDRQVENFFLLLERVGSARARMLQVLVLSYAGWALFAAPMWFAGRALGLPLSPWLVAFAVPVSTLASVIPTPGGVGGVEAAMVLLLSTLGGIPVATAAAVTLCYRLTSYWFVVATGTLATAWVGWR